MDVLRSNSFPPSDRDRDASALIPRSAFLEFGSTTIKLYLPRRDPHPSLERGAAPAGIPLDQAPINGVLVDEVKVPWELGHDVFQTGRIRRRTIDRCIRALKKLQDRFPDVDFRSTPAVGTAALREAANADSLQDAVLESLALRIHLIDGAIEAHLLEAGFRDSIAEFPTALFDLGGGSLELVRYVGPDATTTSSLPLGAIRLHCSLEHIRDRAAYAEEGRRLATASLRRHLNGSASRYRDVFGTGGTVRAVMGLVGKDTLTAVDIAHLRRRALEGDLHDDLEPHRREVFLAGLLILQGLFATLGVERMAYRGASVQRGLIDLAGALRTSESVAS